VSLLLAPVERDDIVVDVASERSVFPDLIRTLSHASVFRQDLIYPRGLQDDRIGGSAADMPIGAQFATKLFLHNSFEHFEGDTDTSFVREAWRVLKPGGVVCIVPLFLSDSHRILTDPLVDRGDIEWDPEAALVAALGYRNRFGRFYSPETLLSRVIVPARESGFEPVVYYFENVRTLDPTSGMHFGLVFKKPDADPETMLSAASDSA
jgi:SAM-dependent methyltransferase